MSLPDWFVIVNLGILSDSEHLLLLLTIPCTRRWLMCTIRPRKLSINRDFSSNISARVKSFVEMTWDATSCSNEPRIVIYTIVATSAGHRDLVLIS